MNLDNIEEECKNCMNCRDYGVWEDNMLIVPCLNHAYDCNYTWQGRRCLGASNGLYEISAEELAEYVYSSRIIDNLKITQKLALQANLSICDFCKQELPEESHFHFNTLFGRYKDNVFLAKYGRMFFCMCMQDIGVTNVQCDTIGHEDSDDSCSELPWVEIEYVKTKSNADIVSRKFKQAYKQGDVVDLTK